MKKVIILLSVAIILSFSACGFKTATSSANTQDRNHQVNNHSEVSASYCDSVQNFEQLENIANYIVRVYVVSTNMKSEFAQEATLKVLNTYKGVTTEEITLYQLASDNVVQQGNEYILFLNPQEPDETNSQIYYPVGGGIGVLRIDETTKEIFVCDNRLLDPELNTWISSNFSVTRAVNYTILVEEE